MPVLTKTADMFSYKINKKLIFIFSGIKPQHQTYLIEAVITTEASRKYNLTIKMHSVTFRAV